MRDATERRVGRDRFSTDAERNVDRLRTSNEYMFGKPYVGNVDSGISNKKEGLLPGSASLNERTKEVTILHSTGADFPVGTEPAKITLAQQGYNASRALENLMQPPATNAPMGNLKASDPRIAEIDPRGENAPPVRTRIDPSIIMGPEEREAVISRQMAAGEQKGPLPRDRQAKDKRQPSVGVDTPMQADGSYQTVVNMGLSKLAPNPASDKDALGRRRKKQG